LDPALIVAITRVFFAQHNTKTSVLTHTRSRPLSGDRLRTREPIAMQITSSARSAARPGGRETAVIGVPRHG
jgi:hypothetical protein